MDTKTTPKDFFMNLLAIAALYVSTVSFIALWFQYIDYLYRDFGVYLASVFDGIRWATSVLVIVFPVFVLVSWLLSREFKHEPGKRETKIRKWLIYLTLFISAVTIIVDLVTLVYNFIGGGLSMAFFLKTLIVLIVASGVFGYYFWDLKRTNLKSGKNRLFAWISSTVVLGTIISAFFLVGTPSVQRERRFDEQRVSDLQILQSEIINYFTRSGSLPKELASLTESGIGFIIPKDPESGSEYEYTVIKSDKPSFELCAIFHRESIETSTSSRYPKALPPPYYGDPYQQNWQHKAGRQCFVKTIDPRIYKPSEIPQKPF